MDSGRPSTSSSGPAPRPEPGRPRLEGAPRGRSAGAPGPAVFKCGRCGSVQRFADEVAASAVCSSCGVALHACINCKHFDTSTQWECREKIPARIAAKDGANECTFFTPKIIRDLTGDKGSSSSSNGSSGGKLSSADEARRAFENLFKK